MKLDTNEWIIIMSFNAYSSMLSCWVHPALYVELVSEKKIIIVM